MTTWHPTDKCSSHVLSNGDLTVAHGGGACDLKGGRGTFGKTAGKWYYEATMNNQYGGIGVALSTWNLDFSGSDQITYYSNSGVLYPTAASFGAAYANPDVVSIAVDVDAGLIWFAKNGVWQGGGDPVAGTGGKAIPAGEVFPCYWLQSAGSYTANFGATAFAHTLPTGFTAWNDAATGPSFVEDFLDIEWGVGGYVEKTLDISWRILNGSESYWSVTDKCSAIVLDASGLTASIASHVDPCNLKGGRATKSKTSGKWYFEVTLDAPYSGIGVANASWDLNYSSGNQFTYYSYNGASYPGGGALGTGYVAGDVVGVAVDVTNGKVWFSKNGVWQGGGDPVAGTGGFTAPAAPLFPSYWLQSTGAAAQITGAFSSDLFASAAPTGFLAWDEAGGDNLLVSDSLSFSWQITSIVEDSLPISWQILSEVTDSLDISWQIFNTMFVTDSLLIRWGINDYVEDSLPISWQIEDFVTLSAEDAFQMSWQILEHVSDSQPISWRIDGYAQAEQEISWPINTYVTATVELSWSIIVSLTVPEDEYTNASDLAARLIAKKGRPLILRRREDAVPSDPARPWAVDRGGVHDHQMYGVVLDYHKKNIDGELIKRGDKRVLVAASELVIEPAPRDLVFERDGSDEWTVVSVEVLRPGETSILYTLQIRR